MRDRRDSQCRTIRWGYDDDRFLDHHQDHDSSKHHHRYSNQHGLRHDSGELEISLSPLRQLTRLLSRLRRRQKRPLRWSQSPQLRPLQYTNGTGRTRATSGTPVSRRRRRRRVARRSRRPSELGTRLDGWQSFTLCLKVVMYSCLGRWLITFRLICEACPRADGCERVQIPRTFVLRDKSPRDWLRLSRSILGPPCSQPPTRTAYGPRRKALLEVM